MEDVEAGVEPRIPRLLGYLVRLRVQFVSSVILAVLLPVTVRWGADFEMWAEPQQVTTLIAAPVAILLGLVALRQISTVPGARETYYLAPTMAVSFLIVLAVMLLIRVEYNRYLFPTALAISIVWIFLTYAVSKASAAAASPSCRAVPPSRWCNSPPPSGSR